VRALLWDGAALRVGERPQPVAGAGMAVVRVHLAGICNTDLELVRGYMGFRGVLGHEMVGSVVAGPAEWRGRRVVAEINFACANCPTCARGLQRHCPQRRVMGILGADGAFADYVAVPVANLHAVPDDVDDAAAVFTEPLAAAFEILEQLGDVTGGDAIVFGDGKLGLLVAQVLQGAGARVVAVGRHDEKLAILRERGIETARAADWPGSQADLVVEATGAAAGFARAVAATRPRGRLVLKSTVAGAVEADLAPLVINEIQVVGSRCGPFAPALRAITAGEVDVRSLVSARFSLRDGIAAFARARARGVLKVLLAPTD
jgi:threonine dehydrogenase-like Zn-dependent dehydrogenase